MAPCEFSRGHRIPRMKQAAIGGLMYASRVASANPTQGSGLMLDAIAAVFLGMTMSEEGEPRVLDQQRQHEIAELPQQRQFGQRIGRLAAPAEQRERIDIVALAAEQRAVFAEFAERELAAVFGCRVDVLVAREHELRIGGALDVREQRVVAPVALCIQIECVARAVGIVAAREEQHVDAVDRLRWRVTPVARRDAVMGLRIDGFAQPGPKPGGKLRTAEAGDQVAGIAEGNMGGAHR